MVDLFVVIADRDCDRQRNTQRLGQAASADPRVAWCCAIEEVEIWMLALHRGEFATWNEVRAHCDVKEHYALPFLARRRFSGPGKGRKAAMALLGQEWRGLLQVCNELATLRETIRTLG